LCAQETCLKRRFAMPAAVPDEISTGCCAAGSKLRHFCLPV